ncbi:MAG: hypothetical protein HOW73_40615 [Polyangiaceae bacterium]|nr:hypothetical protein [Polyangiaceae bacterium]
MKLVTMGNALLYLGIATFMVVLLAAAEVAFRIGRRHEPRTPEPVRSQVVTIQAAMLGLLALLLAFTLSMAERRFSARRALIVDEANAIGTTYLRAEFLPEPARSESREMLRRYVDQRVAFYGAQSDEVQTLETTSAAQLLQAALWARATDTARANPESETTKLYVASLNEMIDLEGKRFAALFATLPSTIVVLLVVVAVVAMASTGYSSGLTGRRGALALRVVPALVGLACAVVLDLDHPRLGLIRAPDVAMERVQNSVAKDASVEIDADPVM